MGTARGIIRRARRNLLEVSRKKILVPGDCFSVGERIHVEGKEELHPAEGEVLRAEKFREWKTQAPLTPVEIAERFLGRCTPSGLRKAGVLCDIVNALLDAGKKSLAKKILRTTEKEAALFSKDPWRLYVKGKVDYATAAYLASRIPSSDPRWEEAAGMIYAVEEAYRSGNFPVRAKDSLSPERIESLSEFLCGKLVLEDGWVWLNWVWGVKERTLEVIKEDLEKGTDLPELGDPAADRLLKSRYSILTGPAGSGKTTLLRAMKEFLEKKGFRVKLTATTGKAATNLGNGARTIQKELGMGGKGNGRKRMFERDTIDADLLVVDEASMLSWHLTFAIFRAAHNSGCAVILSGDPNQLPPVEGDRVFHRLMRIIPVVRLEKIWRSGGKLKVFRVSPEEAVERTVKACRRLLERGADPMNVQVLTPVNKGELGTARLNKLLQDTLNPEGEPVGSGKFRVGDKVIAVKNCYDRDVPVHNGQMGVVAGEDDLGIWVRLNTGFYIPFREGEIELAYALTIHKAQGSEFDYVILILPRSLYSGFIDERMEYVGKTRGRRATVCAVV